MRATGLLALSVLGSLAPVFAQAPAPPVFGARVETVYVDAFVTKDGLAVQGLTAADFELKDNGVVQALELASVESVPLVSVLAFDASGSVAGPKLAALQAAGGAFLDGLKRGDEAALVTFNEEVRWDSEPTSDRERVKTALGSIRARGGSAVMDGLFTAVTLPVSKARSLVVLFSDGEDNLSWLSDAQVKTIVERSNALVHVVGLAPSRTNQLQMGSSRSPSGRLQEQQLGSLPPGVELAHNRALRQIAEATGGRFWTADSPDRLRHTFAAIAEAMGQRYVLRYEPRDAAVPGWHRIDLKLRTKSGRVESRRGYWVGRS